MFKKIFLKGQEEKELLAYETWVVEWESRYDKYSSDVKKEFEIFTSNEDAKIFKQRLVDAFNLVKHTSGNKVKISKRLKRI